MQTLFGEEWAEKVKENASAAFKTAQLSANDYYETVSTFAASLKQAVGDDMAKAVELSDRAIQSMADNANKMGTDMSSIQATYQGFAKQNYTMLDNLKLGYGGTKTEMERLIKDASMMTSEMEALGVSVDADSMSFDNIVNAISVVQAHLGMAGVSSQEAETTISGSFNAMKAAAENLVSYLTTGNDIQPAVKNLIDTTLTFAENNFIPALTRIIEAIPTLIIGLIDSLPGFVKSGVEMVFKLVQGLVQAIPKIIEAIPQLVKAIWEGITSVNWLELGRDIISGIVNGIKSAIGYLIEAAKEAARNALQGVKNFLGIHSPSTVFRDQVGKMMGLGIAEGIDDEKNAVSKSINDLARGTIGTFDSSISVSGSSPSSNGDNMVSALYAVANIIVNAINNKDTSVVIDGDAIGSAAARYLNSQSRRFGTAVV